jgi:tetratricopeptide (TPR) repeat protein
VSPAADFEAAMRRELSIKGALCFGDEYAAAEMERLLKTALAPGVIANEGTAFELALYEPRLAEAFFRVKGTAKFIKAAAGLVAGNFTARMYGALARQPLDVSQKDAFSTALEEGRRDLQEALAGRLPPAEKPGPHALFSFEMARVSSDRAFRAGIKAYANAAFGEAAGFFAEALRLCRDNPYAWLYFARSFEAGGEYNECGPAYEKALALFERGGLAGPEMIETVKKELETFRRRGGVHFGD